MLGLDIKLWLYAILACVIAFAAGYMWGVKHESAACTVDKLEVQVRAAERVIDAQTAFGNSMVEVVAAGEETKRAIYSTEQKAFATYGTAKRAHVIIPQIKNQTLEELCKNATTETIQAPLVADHINVSDELWRLYNSALLPR